MGVRNNLLKVFNDYKVVAEEDTLEIAKQFKFKYSKKTNEWTQLPREIKGETVSKLFQKFMDEYKKNYRFKNAVDAFYQLSDTEIEEMFEELPYYLKTFIGKEMYKPNAASFLKEKIWQQDYPNKPQRDRTKKLSILEASSWDEHILSLPEEQRSAAENYKQLINFEAFKSLINVGKKG